MEFFLVKMIRVMLRRIHCQVMHHPNNVSRCRLELPISRSFTYWPHYVIPSIVEDNCSDSYKQNCTIVEGNITLKVEGGTGIVESLIMDEANTAVQHALIELEDQGVLGVKLVGNNTMSLSFLDQYSQKQLPDTADDDWSSASNSWIIFVGCSLFVGAVLFALFWSNENRIAFLRRTTRSGYFFLE